MLCYGVVSPHAPILLPEIGGDETRKVKKTITSLEKCAKALKDDAVDHILIISPHTDHGFGVPLHFLKGDISDSRIRKILVGIEDYFWYFDYGKALGTELQNDDKNRWAIIASADLSHALKADGPYEFHPNGPKLDLLIQSSFKRLDYEVLLKLDRSFIADAAECGLRSILFLLGAFATLKEKAETFAKVKSRVLSYEGPWGVGYMVGDIRLIDNVNKE